MESFMKRYLFDARPLKDLVTEGGAHLTKKDNDKDKDNAKDKDKVKVKDKDKDKGNDKAS